MSEWRVEMHGHGRTRVFNDRDYPSGDDPDPDGINLDRSTGIITLPGFHHISGLSLDTYYDDPSDPTGRVPTNPTPAVCVGCRQLLSRPQVAEGAPGTLA